MFIVTIALLSLVWLNLERVIKDYHVKFIHRITSILIGITWGIYLVNKLTEHNSV